VNDINRQQVERQNFEAANAERKKQMSQESAKLLKLAAALKAEVDKNDKDALPPGAMRKADEIEKLAHSVKEKMQLTVGPS
jgi:tRNA pseudouridine-54 N-methylase